MKYGKKRGTVLPPAVNEQFGVRGGVAPQKPLCNFAGFSPARASVSRFPRQAATTLKAYGSFRVSLFQTNANERK